MDSRFIYMIFAIMLVLMVNPFIRPLGLVGHITSTLFIAMTPLSCALALTQDRKKAIMILLIATPFVVLDGLNVFFTSRLWQKARCIRDSDGQYLYGSYYCNDRWEIYVSTDTARFRKRN
jgi:hypothetical protein